MQPTTKKGYMATDNETTQTATSPPVERLAYSIEEAAEMLGINYHSIYRLIQRGKLKACRALRGKLLISRDELLKLLKSE
jgi:excisionase family DNA binding protein